MKRLEGKIAIVTGAGRGIGRSTAELFAREGAVVYATARSAHEEFEDEGIAYRSHDAGDEAGWHELVAEIVERHGRIDVLVNNAGIIEYDPVDALSLDAWNRVVAVSQTGVFLGMREVIPHMITQGGLDRQRLVDLGQRSGRRRARLSRHQGRRAQHVEKRRDHLRDHRGAGELAASGLHLDAPHREPGPEVNEYVVGQTPMGRAGNPEDRERRAVVPRERRSQLHDGRRAGHRRRLPRRSRRLGRIHPHCIQEYTS